MARWKASALTWVLLLSAAGLRADESGPDTSAARMAEAARVFLASLDDDRRAEATFPFSTESREDWHYIPKRQRKGLALKQMASEQLHLAHVLLNAALSRSGYAKTATIMSLESLVRDAEASQGRTVMLQLRDPNLYYISIFGEPRDDSNWGWSLEGHHVSLNFTVVPGRGVASTPSFLGAEPHEVLDGPRRGLRVLGREEDRARALLASLSAEQRAKAVLDDTAPADILSRVKARIEPAEPQGLAASEMDPSQRELLAALVEEYIANLPADLAGQRRAQLRAAGEHLHFAWMGATTRAPGGGHYYRVRAPTFLIEYDNVQNAANHSHTVWRDYNGDFGRDLLLDHHQEHHQGRE